MVEYEEKFENLQPKQDLNNIITAYKGSKSIRPTKWWIEKGRELAKEISKKERLFSVQEHDATQLHHDLRLEKNRVMESWAVPKGVPSEPEKNLAVKVGPHPIEYSTFEGVILPNQYGAGTVKLVDFGLYELKSWSEDKISLKFDGRRGNIEGDYSLVGMDEDWLLIKK